MSRTTNHTGLEGENARLREELRNLREEFRHLTLRVDRQEDRLSELSDSVSAISGQSIEVVSSVGGASSAPAANSVSGAAGSIAEPIDPVGPYSWSLRDAVARDIGAFLKRCLEGDHRGESGRDRTKGLQSQVCIVVRDFDRRVYNPPLLLKTFSEVKRICKRDGSCGDSVFIGVPSYREASLAVSAAGLQWPSEAQ
eukprot:s255_g28.t1